MNRNGYVRRTHRVVALVFLATVVVAIVVLAAAGPDWVAYFPLPPLALLLLTGGYLYLRPYLGPATDLAAHRARGGATGVRAVHRIGAAGFVTAIVITSIVLAVQGPMWVSYLPLLPLAALLFSGLFMLVRPRSRGVVGQGTAPSAPTA